MPVSVRTSTTAPLLKPNSGGMYPFMHVQRGNRRGVGRHPEQPIQPGVDRNPVLHVEQPIVHAADVQQAVVLGHPAGKARERTLHALAGERLGDFADRFTCKRPRTLGVLSSGIARGRRWIRPREPVCSVSSTGSEPRTTSDFVTMRAPPTSTRMTYEPGAMSSSLNAPSAAVVVVRTGWPDGSCS